MILRDRLIEPEFRTSPDRWSEEEKIKYKTRGFTEIPDSVVHELKDEKDELSYETSIIAKSCGIYLEFNRDKFRETREKDYIYMIRIVIPGGGPITAKQWEILDEISNRYTVSDAYTKDPKPSLRLTTRQDIQLHHVKKRDLLNAIQDIVRSGFFTLNGCGDNVRNVVACPLSFFSSIFNSNSLAKEIANYFRLPTGPYIQVFELDSVSHLDTSITHEGRFRYSASLLNRKFKIAISALHLMEGKLVRDNCVEATTNDIGIVPVDGKLFQLYVGGGQGENQGFSTFSTLGKPLGVFNREELVRALDVLVNIQQEWGDRKNRHWARMKYLVYKMGIEWLREKIRETGLEPEPPLDLDVGDRMLHLGPIRTEVEAYGIFVENGRVIDREDSKYKTGLLEMVRSYPDAKIFITPNQHLIVTGIDDLREFEVFMSRFLKKPTNLRMHATACVGFPTCKLSYTDSERFLPRLIGELERRWGDLKETIGISGCLAQCSRPGTKTLGWVGTGYNLYMLKVGGDSSGRFQGNPLIDPDTGDVYLTHVPGNRLADVTDALFELYSTHGNGEGMGQFLRKLGNKRIIEYLKNNPKTSDLMTPSKLRATLD
ncbi:sulfite reductase (NADPH) beta subunit [Metallosphaera sedula]|uniref:Sulfite reductase (NADPH) beta subunit n=2 Tax=Metallosphaera sedula TaxID=43687 RepID=A4YFD0_METS5|nr:MULTISPECIES: nitrite/sulfite reductase [Metallosphaera]ABP95132.1 sulfite reductase (NADPH) beta subunit [Metallosphaera sedula DSM 5348]AIM27118.1 sulfite reductase (NADPH) beta subunit [Metallosphaera sedula]AKV74026.1 nitrite reductase [Metallosphaera sedula]AKV76265.1 nitrite reductase [Metallosphaera sedula]AKV78518.1 nitrite reductase [Metallosphaera sedula]